MNIPSKLKELIFKRLYKELSNAEIIPYNDSIWFIDREKKYWYFEFENNTQLWWRYDFFTDFFKLFCIDKEIFEIIISEWVEEVLNCEVKTTTKEKRVLRPLVEEVLNYKVLTTHRSRTFRMSQVEEVLNHSVNTTVPSFGYESGDLEDVLRSK